jgi:hypothetical protein
MTEKDALQKWCPLGRILIKSEWSSPHGGVALAYGSHNIDSKGKHLGKCIASDCMMWRWMVDKQEGYCGTGGAV